MTPQSIGQSAEFRYNRAWRRWVFSSSRRAAVANSGPSIVRTTSRALFSLLFPSDCRICGHPLEEISRTPVCSGCLDQPQRLDAEFFCSHCGTPFQNRFPLDEEGRCALCRNGLRGFDRAYSFGAYDGVLRQLIHVYKYGRVRTLALPLGELLARALPREERFDFVAAVPLHWRRRWQRGFNQSELLARAIAHRWNVPCVRALRRVRSTPAQAGLSNSRRRRNVAGAFTCPNPRLVSGRRVLVVDDVLTTGSTAAACAYALKQAGAARITFLTVARADRRMDFMPFPAAHSSVGGTV
jgi:ComF family protein